MNSIIDSLHSFPIIQSQVGISDSWEKMCVGAPCGWCWHWPGPGTMSGLDANSNTDFSPALCGPAARGDTLGGTPGLKRRSLGSSCGSASSMVSPDTEEFESLEKSFKEELEQKLHERKVSEPDGVRRLSSQLSLSNSSIQEDQQMSLQLVEKRQLRSFSRADEYLYAMKEDLAEWLQLLYPHINIDAENFMDTLQTGEHLLKVSAASTLWETCQDCGGSIYNVQQYNM